LKTELFGAFLEAWGGWCDGDCGDESEYGCEQHKENRAHRFEGSNVGSDHYKRCGLQGKVVGKGVFS
jgi:hypothetical protein